MAAESVGLTASIAGIVSLGLQIVGGIIKYVDAVENRQEELESVSRQSKALNAILAEADSMFRSHGQPGAVPESVAQSMQMFKNELSHLQELHTKLADSEPQSRTARLENKKKKVTYAFKRSRIQELGLRLQKAGDALQLTLNVLGLKVSRQQTDMLMAAQTLSQGISFEVALVRSEVAAIETPIAKISDQLYLLQGSIESNNQLRIAQDQADQGRNDHVLRNVQDTNGIVLHQLAQFRSRHEREATKRHQEVMKMLRDLQISRGNSHSSETVVRRLPGKPALLKEISDEVQQGQTHNQLLEPDPYIRPSTEVFGPSSRHYPSRPVVGKVCTCPRLKSVTRSKWIELGHVSFFSEREAIAHWPGCPMVKASGKKRTMMGFGYNGLVRILKTAIQVSFAMTSGAGGFSISPNLTFSPTVDDNFDPAFQIIHLIDKGLRDLGGENPEPFLIACIKRLDRLLNDGRASATAVNSQNKSLMHAVLALGNSPWQIYGTMDLGIICSLIVELVQLLLTYGAAAFTYDLEGVSPLVTLKSRLFDYEHFEAVIDVLLRANSENQPLVLNASYIENNFDITVSAIPIMDFQLLYDLSSGFAEVSECGPLSMAVIQDDADAVEHMLKRTPGSIAEIDIFGQTPFHLAAANPLMLNILLKHKDCNILDQRDIFGFTALELAMIRSSEYCDNRWETTRCDGKACGCCLCVDLFLGAACDVRMHKLAKMDYLPKLYRFLTEASELARRKYVYYMKRQRGPATRSPPSNPHALSKSSNCEPNTDFEVAKVQGNATASSQQQELSSMPDVADDMSWVFLEIEDPHLGALFYHYGFRPHPSCLTLHFGKMDYPYLDWLVSHAADPFFRSSKGPPITQDSPNIGLFGAHFAFYSMSLRPDAPATGPWDSYMALAATICREDLTDGCRCCCTTHGCSPFTWMMKGSYLMSSSSRSSQIHEYDVKLLVDHYSQCGLEMTSLTYKAAIRYATFGALGLVHTCCDATEPAEFAGEWVEKDDVVIVNEEQAPLLDLLEDLVGEFEEKAVQFMKIDSRGHSLFPNFWTLCWKIRVEVELEKLEGNELTDAERRGAEELGVQWTVSQQAAEEGNPYGKKDPKHWFYELDKICPEYAEPWPD